jgi:WD40 repeat protein
MRLYKILLVIIAMSFCSEFVFPMQPDNQLVNSAVCVVRRLTMLQKDLSCQDRWSSVLSVESDKESFPAQGQNGQLLDVYYGDKRPEYIKSIVFSPNDKKMVSGGGIEGTTSLASLLWWDVDKDDNIETVPHLFSEQLELPFVRSVAFSHDGQILAAGGGKCCDEFCPNNFTLWAFKKDGSFNSIPQILDGYHKGMVNVVAFHPKRKVMFSGGAYEKNILMWNFDKADTVNVVPQILEGHLKAGIKGLVFNADGTTMISVSGGKGTENNLLLWRFSPDGAITATSKIVNDFSCIDSIAFSSHGKKFFLGTTQAKERVKETEVFVYSFDDKNDTSVKKDPIPFCSDPIGALVLNNDDKIILTTSQSDPEIFLYDQSNRKACTIKCPDNSCFATFNPKNNKIVMGLFSDPDSPRYLLGVCDVFKPEEEKLFTEFSRNLTPSGAKLILALNSCLKRNEEGALSTEYQRIYDKFPVEIQTLFKDAVIKARRNLTWHQRNQDRIGSTV